MQKIFKKINRKEGFTLVEVIVVLIIIGVLAAVAVPAMTGYIDDSRQKVAVADARNALMAAQVTATERYAKSTLDSFNKDVAQAAYADLTGTSGGGTINTISADSATGNITAMTFTTQDGRYTVTYDSSNTAEPFTTKKND